MQPRVCRRLVYGREESHVVSIMSKREWVSGWSWKVDIGGRKSALSSSISISILVVLELLKVGGQQLFLRVNKLDFPQDNRYLINKNKKQSFTSVNQVPTNCFINEFFF